MTNPTEHRRRIGDRLDESITGLLVALDAVQRAARQPRVSIDSELERAKSALVDALHLLNDEDNVK
ncbi:MAG: hypothetical protein DMD60_14215 [Gemmatimonadetes bacterium]|nr:MAG: hypothetical protein DMD60_14215 [Gemmatimonadota bacterium]